MGANAGQIRAGKAFVEAGWNDSALVKGLKATGQKLKAWGSSIRNVGLAVSGMAAAVTAPLAALAYKATESGSELYFASQRTGIAVEALSELKYVADQNGASFEDLQTGLKKMSKFVVAAAEGTGTATEALDLMGLSIEQLNNASPEKRFNMIADGISRIQDPTVQAAVAMEAFGKNGVQLIPMLQDGAAGIAKWRDHARELGLTTSGQSAKSAVEFRVVLKDLQAVLAKIGSTVGQAVIPVLKRKVELITGIVVKGLAWAKANKDVITTIFKIASLVGIAGAALVVLGTIVSTVGSALGAMATVFVAIASAVGFLLSPIGLVIAAVVGLAAYFLFMTESGRAVQTYLGSAFKTLAGDVSSAFGGISNAIAAGDWTLAAEIAWTALRLVFQRGVNALADIWNSFGPDTLKFFSDTWTGVLALTEVIWSALRDGWTEAARFFVDVWTSAVWAVKRLWIEAREGAKEAAQTTREVSKGVRSAIGPLADVLAATTPLGVAEGLANVTPPPAPAAQVDAEKAAVNKEAYDAILQNEAESNAAREAEKLRHQLAMSDIASAGQSRGNDMRKLTIDTTDLTALLDERSKQNAKAAAEAAKPNKAGPPGLPKLPNPDDIGKGLDELSKRGSASVGTFSGVAAALLGRRDDTAARTARATEATAKATAALKGSVDKILLFH
jgi:hypothetical protein